MAAKTLGLGGKEFVVESALLTRFTEMLLLDYFGQGKLFGTVHTCIGEEFSGSTILSHLKSGDTVFSNHRCHGHFLSLLGDVEGLAAELMGRSGGVSSGFGGSQHLHKDGFYSNGIQGGIVPVAAGLAMGHKVKSLGAISVVFIGDGTWGEGVVYETVNIAAKWGLPLLLVVEDNKYSQSTSQHETLSGTIRDRAAAFGIDYLLGNTWEWETLLELSATAVSRVRSESRPVLLHVDTYRLKAHSKGDDIRPRAEVEVYEAKDPLNQFMAAATPEQSAWIEGIRKRVQAAFDAAEAQAPAAFPEQAVTAPKVGWQPAKPLPSERIVNLLNRSLRAFLGEQALGLMIGEDILSPYGGAFKASKDLSDLFPGRVLNSPISEGAIAGIGGGLALAGCRPIVEIMFGDFIGLAFDQILNHAAKFQQMYAMEQSCDLVIRTPMGGGRGYGPTHSQTLDRHFYGIPGLTMVALNALTEPEQLYRPLQDQGRGAVLVIENKQLYGGYPLSAPAEGYQLWHSDETFPSAWLKPEADHVDVTLLGYGGMADLLVEACEILFVEHDLVAQILCPMQIYPFSVTPHLDLLRRAPRLLIAEEGQGFAGFGAEVLGQLAEQGALNGLAVGRVYPRAYCIPSSGLLEKDTLPSVEDVVKAVLKMGAK